MRQKLRKRNIDKRRNCLSEKINQNDLMSKKHKNVYAALNYIEHQLSLQLGDAFPSLLLL